MNKKMCENEFMKVLTSLRSLHVGDFKFIFSFDLSLGSHFFEVKSIAFVTSKSKIRKCFFV